MLKALIRRLFRVVFRCMPSRQLRNKLRTVLYRLRGGWPIEFLAEPGETVVQVGTPNPLTIRNLLAGCGPTGTVVVIEAVGANFQRLTKSLEGFSDAQRKSLVLVNKAAFSRKASLEIALSSRYDGDHMIAGLDTVMDNLDRADADFRKTETVEADTLDNILGDLGTAAPGLLIVTVNGAEHEVLRGAQGTLACMPTASRVFAKAHARRSDGGTLVEEVATLLDDSGFQSMRTRRSRSVSEDPGWRYREGDVFAFKKNSSS